MFSYRHLYGFDRPVIVQYLSWIGGLFPSNNTEIPPFLPFPVRIMIADFAGADKEICRPFQPCRILFRILSCYLCSENV